MWNLQLKFPIKQFWQFLKTDVWCWCCILQHWELNDFLYHLASNFLTFVHPPILIRPFIHKQKSNYNDYWIFGAFLKEKKIVTGGDWKIRLIQGSNVFFSEGGTHSILISWNPFILFVWVFEYLLYHKSLLNNDFYGYHFAADFFFCITFFSLITMLSFFPFQVWI